MCDIERCVGGDTGRWRTRRRDAGGDTVSPRMGRHARTRHSRSRHARPGDARAPRLAEKQMGWNTKDWKRLVYGCNILCIPTKLNRTAVFNNTTYLITLFHTSKFIEIIERDREVDECWLGRCSTTLTSISPLLV